MINWLIAFSLLTASSEETWTERPIEDETLGFVEVDPGLDWKTSFTQYFRIHHTPETSLIAERLSEIADPIFESLTAQFRSRPRLPIQVVLLNGLDITNGYSTPFPYNTIVLYTSLPDDGSSLDDYDQWLTLLFTHELTHTIHIDMVAGANKFLRALFGSFIIPNSGQPQWLIEGFGVHNESTRTHRGRGKSAYLDMYFRDAVMRDDLLPIERGLYWNDVYPYGQAPYWYGMRFYEWISEKYGERKWVDFAHKNSAWLVPGFLNFKTKSIFGKSFHRLWAEWQADEVKKQQTHLRSYPSKFKAEALLSPKESSLYVNGVGTWDPDGKYFYASTENYRERRNLVRWTYQDGKFTEPTIIREGFGTGRLSLQNGHFVYTKLALVDPFKNYSDLFAWNLETKKEVKLTNGFRIKDVFVHGNSVYAVRSDAFQSSIIRIPLPDLTKLNPDDHEPLEDLTQVDVVYQAKAFDNISFPSVSPNGRQLVFSMHRESLGRDIFLLDLESQNLQQLTNDWNLDYHPSFSEDGQSVYFVSDRELGNSKVRVFNLYSVDLQSKDLLQLSDTWTGIYWPIIRGNQIIAGHYQNEGFVLSHFEKKSSGLTRRAQSELNTQRSPSIPPILAAATPIKRASLKSSYDSGDTLLPHFLAPFGFYTEDDSLVGLATLSRDPLGYHTWSLVGYHYITPNRPGGFFNYVYGGLRPLTLGASVGAGISNYGNIWLRGTLNPSNEVLVTADDYYERTYAGSVFAAYQIFKTNFSLSHALSFQDRRPLLPRPSNLMENQADLDALGIAPTAPIRSTQLAPEKAQQWTLATRINWKIPASYEYQMGGIGPYKGTGLSLGVDYSPEVLGGDLHLLVTTLRAHQYLELARNYHLAFSLIGGMQWLDVIYQRTFRLGGSTSNFFRSNRSFMLRGLGEGELRGEGVVAGSAEFRFPLLSSMPGFGTAPLWFRNLHGALFTDAGQTFVKNADKNITAFDLLTGREQSELAFSNTTLSVGAELRSDISLTYAPPLTFRLGYGHVLFLEGENVSSEKINEFYFQAVSSF